MSIERSVHLIDPRHEGLLLAARSGLSARLEDPFLTDHDRWVLRQFARFLAGDTPVPDPRVTPLRVERPLYPRVRGAGAGVSGGKRTCP